MLILKCSHAPVKATTNCPTWCVRTHPENGPAGYHESAPLLAWEKEPGEVRTVTAVRFAGEVAARVRAPEWVAVKGGAKPLMFTLDQTRELSWALGALPGGRQVHDRAVELLAA